MNKEQKKVHDLIMRNIDKSLVKVINEAYDLEKDFTNMDVIDWTSIEAEDFYDDITDAYQTLANIINVSDSTDFYANLELDNDIEVIEKEHKPGILSATGYAIQIGNVILYTSVTPENEIIVKPEADVYTTDDSVVTVKCNWPAMCKEVDCVIAENRKSNPFANRRNTRKLKNNKSVRRINENAKKSIKRAKSVDMNSIIKKAVNESLNKHIKKNNTLGKQLKNALNEGGHICWTDEDGNFRTNSKDLWRNVPGTRFIWHGEWSDPEIYYNGELLNYNDVEDSLWNYYKEVICDENGEIPTEEGYEAWVEREDPDWLKSQLDDILYGMYGD